MATLQARMDGLFEYKHNPLYHKRVYGLCALIFEGERGQNLNIFSHTKPNKLAHLA
jgi:hypothetical protein